MSFPPPPSKVHFIHNHPSDQTEPNPLGRIEHSHMLDNLSGILCCKSTSTLRNWTCYSLLVLERWTILYLNSSVPSSSSSAYHSKRSCRLYFIYLFFLKNCIYCFATPGVSLFFPEMVKKLFREKMASTQAMKHEKSTLLALLQLLQATAWEDSSTLVYW